MMIWVTLGLSVLSLILHVVAPRTKTKVDDTLRDVVDVGKSVVGSVPVPRADGGVVQAPGTGDNRDHRTPKP